MGIELIENIKKACDKIIEEFKESPHLGFEIGSIQKLESHIIKYLLHFDDAGYVVKNVLEKLKEMNK